MQRSIPSWPWGPLCLALALGACDESSNLVSGPIGPIPTTLAIVSGNHQDGMAHRWQSDPFVVRLSDAHGAPLPGGAVYWSVASGGGDLCDTMPVTCPGGPVQTITNADGEAKVWLAPVALGAILVRAIASGLEGSPVTFQTNAVGLVVYAYPPSDCNNPMQFFGLEGTGPVTVPVGTIIEWEILACGGRIASTTGPAGVMFDSGPLNPSESFAFVPTVVGRWDYQDVYTGGTGTLIAIP